MQDQTLYGASSISNSLFSERMTPFHPYLSDHVAVAVSGGVDSMALALLLKDYCDTHKIKLTALIIDHDLRDCSAEDTHKTAAHLNQRDISHVVLKWQHDGIETAVQNKARQARYALMTEWCQNHQANMLFLAHHADDLVETFWLRLLSKTGLDGLSCIPALRKDKMTGIYFARPLLSFAKEQLIATCKHHNQDWVEDPTNAKTSYTRNQVRQVKAELPLKEKEVLRLTSVFGRLRQHIECDVIAALKATTTVYNAGYAKIDLDAFQQQPEHIQSRVLQKVTQAISGRFYPYRSANLENALQKLGQDDVFTFGGCVFETKENTLFIARETKAVEEFRCSETHIIWDNRFQVKTEKTLLSFSVLQERGLSFLPQNMRKNYDGAYKSYPRFVRQALPVVEENGQIIAVPALDYWDLAIFGNKKPISIEFLYQNSLFQPDIEIV